MLSLPLPDERTAASRLALVCAARFFAVGAVFGAECGAECGAELGAVFRAVFGAEFRAVFAGLGLGLGLELGLAPGLGRDLGACALFGARGDAACLTPIMLFQALPI